MIDRKSRKKRPTTQRQERILNAALEIFSRKGYAAATIPEIARLAGVAVGTIYIYYPGKRELFIAVIKNLIITIPLLDLIDKMPTADMTVIFKQILQNRFSLIKTGPIVQIPSLMAEIQRDPELKVLWAEQFVQPFFNRMEGVYRAMMASGRFRRMEPAIAARAIGGLILGFLILKIMEDKDSPLNRLPQEKVADDLVSFVLHGLTNEEGERKN